MAFENPFSSPNKNEKEQPDEKQQAENAAEHEMEDDQEESVGPRAGEYRDAAGVSHSTYSLREGLDEETLKKLENMKSADQDDKENGSGDMKKAA